MILRPDRAWMRALTPLAVAAVAITGLHFFVLARGARETTALRAQARSMLADQASMSQGTRQVTEWLRRAGSGTVDQSSGDTLSLASAIPFLLQRISAVSEAHGVRVLSIRPDAPGAPIVATAPDGSQASYARLPVHLIATARFADLGGFLEDLDHESGLARVTSVKLTLDRGRRALTVEMIVDAFGRIGS